MKRRTFFAAAAGTAAAGLAATASAAAAKPATLQLDTTFTTDPKLGRSIPVNKERAYQVMDEHKLDGLIALRTINVYYLTNTVTTLTAFGAEYPAFATFPRKADQPTFLLSSIGNTWETINAAREVPQVITMSGAKNWQDYINPTAEKMKVEPESSGRQGGRFAMREGAQLTEREKGWKRAQEIYGDSSGAGPAWSLVHAMKQSGMMKGRIAVDDMRIALLLQAIGVEGVTFVDGDNIFRQIRHVKTENEIALLRVAQKLTQDSAMTMARALAPGMTYEEARQRFFAEAAARGGEAGFLLLGMTQGLLPSGVVKKGESYMMDCSVHFKLYQGDFARTIMIGEPSAENMRRFKAQQIAREEAFSIIKAGVPFTKVEQVARDAMVKAGMPKDIPTISLHSIGLQHGDDPGRMDTPYAVRGDLVLAENMTVTLDLPYLQVGQGGGHNEDMLRITKTGYEILNDPKDPLVVVG